MDPEVVLISCDRAYILGAVRRYIMEEYTKATDGELISACLGGDSRAWEALLNRYRRLIYSIPFKYRLSPDDTADVFQSVCVALLEGLKLVRDESKLSSWLITTTMRECWKLKRRQRREPYLLDGQEESEQLVEWESGDPLPEEVLQTLQEQHLIRQAIEQLGDRCKSLLIYLFYQKQDWSYERISQSMGLPTSSIGPTRRRCLEKMKRILKRSGFS